MPLKQVQVNIQISVAVISYAAQGIRSQIYTIYSCIQTVNTEISPWPQQCASNSNLTVVSATEVVSPLEMWLT